MNRKFNKKKLNENMMGNVGANMSEDNEDMDLFDMYSDKHDDLNDVEANADAEAEFNAMKNEGTVTVNCDELLQLLKDVEAGELSASAAFGELCGEMETFHDFDSDDRDALDDQSVEECEGSYMESVNRIANLISEDPDLFND